MSSNNYPPKLLCIGLCCVDTVIEVACFPIEDTDQRCLSQRRQRGGNASNNCTVLGILGAEPHFLGTIADSVERRFIENDFQEFGVILDDAIIVEDCECPNSCVIISMATGSRTIIHCNKNLPEVSLKHFTELDIDNYSWIHFEGRNESNVKEMMEYVEKHNKKYNTNITVSVELEKSKPELEVLLPLAEVVFVSKDYALFKGYQSMEETLRKVSLLTKPEAILVCPWGDQGACAMEGKQGKIIRSPSYPPKEIKDTLGAGDTFIPATIFALLCKESLERSINFGCRVAGAKIGVKGWLAFKEAANDLQFIQDMIKKLNS